MSFFKSAKDYDQSVVFCRNMSEEAKQKIRDARAKQVFSDEHRAKMSKSAKNRSPISDETRAKLRITNNRVYTYYTPYGTFNSAGEAHKVTGLLPQTIRKKCDDPNNPDWSRTHHTGKLAYERSEETRAKLRAANLGKTLSDETRAKISASMKKRKNLTNNRIVLQYIHNRKKERD